MISSCPAPGAAAASGDELRVNSITSVAPARDHQVMALDTSVTLGSHKLGKSQEMGQTWLGQEPAPPAQLLQLCLAAHMHSQEKAEPIDIEKLQGLSGNDLLPIKAEVN